MNVLTKEEAVPTSDKDEIVVEVEQTLLRFIDLARQMEAFFLQKRFLLSALKPEMNVKEDISELRLELARKEELLKRHYEKISVWQNLLADLQSYSKSPAQCSSTPGSSSVPPSPLSAIPGNQTPNQMMPSIPATMQQQLQQPMQLQQQQMQQMQQQMMQQQQQQMMQQQVDRR